jgi:hypothetical protein
MLSDSRNEVGLGEMPSGPTALDVTETSSQETLGGRQVVRSEATCLWQQALFHEVGLSGRRKKRFTSCRWVYIFSTKVLFHPFWGLFSHLLGHIRVSPVVVV